MSLMFSKKKDFLYILALVVVSVLYFKQCNLSAHLKEKTNQNQLASKDTLQFYKNKLGLEVAEKKAYQIENTKKDRKIYFQDSLLKEATKKYKKLASVSKVKTITKIQKVFIPYKEEVPFTFTRSFTKTTNNYSIFGTSTNFGVNIDSLLIPNTQIIASGVKKQSFFKTEYVFSITNSNPLIKVNSADTYNFIEKRKRFGIGLVFGIGIYYKNAFVGFGGSYDFLQF